MIQAPIFHVNGDDPETCVRVARLAFAFRQTFKKDVVIDMWCYRRYGHNEADEPSFTQPLMYERIKNRPVRKLYTEALVNQGDITVRTPSGRWAFRQRLQQAFDDTHDEEDGRVAKVELERPAPMAADPAVGTPPWTARPSTSRWSITAPCPRASTPFKLVRWLEQRAGALGWRRRLEPGRGSGLRV